MVVVGLALMALTAGCSPYEWRHENQWESRDQIWLAEASQVKVRAAQSRVFDTADRLKTIQGVVATCQDLGFAVLSRSGWSPGWFTTGGFCVV
jgi:hypothetical protein